MKHKIIRGLNISNSQKNLNLEAHNSIKVSRIAYYLEASYYHKESKDNRASSNLKLKVFFRSMLKDSLSVKKDKPS